MKTLVMLKFVAVLFVMSGSMAWAEGPGTGGGGGGDRPGSDEAVNYSGFRSAEVQDKTEPKMAPLVDCVRIDELRSKPDWLWCESVSGHWYWVPMDRFVWSFSKHNAIR